MSGYVRSQIRARNRKLKLPELARERREKIARETRAKYLKADCSIVEFVPRVSPDLHAPHHLGPYAAVLELATPSNDCEGGIRCVIAAPPQHGKTELVLRAFIWWDLRSERGKGRRHCYVTYNQDRADEVARQFQTLALAAGIKLTGTLDKVRLPNGSTVKFTSIGGSLTGYPIDGVCVVDDPIKGPNEARSPTTRKACVEWFDKVAMTRRHPGTSFIVMATRWHLEDLSGVLIKRGWRYVNLKAIAEGPVNDNGIVANDPLGRAPGEALWPSRKPPEFFAEDRKNAYTWNALYQGEPRPEGGAVFAKPASLYASLPKAGYNGAFGIDLAYTAKNSADYSVCIEGIWFPGDENQPELPRGLYVLDVVRKQVESSDFAGELKQKALNRPGWVFRWYGSGPEKGSASFLTDAGIPLRILRPNGDKLTRATAGRNPCSTGWNGSADKTSPEYGKQLIHLPDTAHYPDATWVADFIEEIQNFTGLDDLHDDIVDALVALWDELAGGNNSFTVGGVRSSRQRAA